MSREPNTVNYRKDIDGLRAVAVLAVVLFHLEFTFLPGGFVGVDVFFVISGYLITKILTRQIGNNAFSFIEFYARRVKRLMPAALAVIATTIIFAYFILTPDKYVELAKSGVMATVLSVNFWFAFNSGYFDQSSELSPFLHLWSLAVEEQYYFVMPVILVAAAKFGKKSFFWTVLLITSSSFLMSAFTSAKYPDTSYYLLHTRAWELGAGGLISFIPIQYFLHRLSSIFQILGLSLVFFSCVFISASDVFPGSIALLPVLGSCLLILFGSEKSAIGKLLCSKLVVLLGKSSYSIYLWHWPIVVFYRVYVSERNFLLAEQIALLILSIGMGWLSYTLVEQRFRYISLSNKKVIGSGVFASFLCFAMSFLVYSQAGFPDRISEKAKALTDRNEMQKELCHQRKRFFDELDESFCIVGSDWDKSEKRAVIWGDSHSIHWAPVMDETARLNGFSLAVLPKQCPPYLDGVTIKENYAKFPSFTEQCALKHSLAKSFLAENKQVTHVILAAAWSGHIRQLYNQDNMFNKTHEFYHVEAAENGFLLMNTALEYVLGFLNESGKQVLVIGDIVRNENGVNVAECRFNELGELLRRPCVSNYASLPVDKVRQWHHYSELSLKGVSKNFENTRYVSLVDTMCNDATCSLQINNEILYRDSNHLRQNLSQETMDNIASSLLLSEFFKKG